MCSNCCMSCSGDREGLWLQSVLVWLLQVLQVRKVWYKNSNLIIIKTVHVNYSFFSRLLTITLWYNAIVISTLTLLKYESFLYSLLCVTLHPCHLEMSFMHVFDPQADMHSSCGSLLDKSSLRLWRRCPHQWVKWLTSYTFPLMFIYHPVLPSHTVFPTNYCVPYC